MRTFRSRIRLLICLATSLGLIAAIAVLPLDTADAVGSPIPYAVYRGHLEQITGDQQVNDSFGESIAIDASTIAIGAPGDDAGGIDAGAVYVSTLLPNGAWGDPYKITGPQAGAKFGYAVSVSGDRIAIGAPYYDASVMADRGTVYVYKRNGATWVAEGGGPLSWTAPAVQGGAHFGTSVAIDDVWLVAGAPDYDVAGTLNAGLVKFYKWDSIAWAEGDDYIQGDLPLMGQNDRFGASIDLDFRAAQPPYSALGHAVVGVPGKGLGADVRSGSVTILEYVANGAAEDWTNAVNVTAPTKQAEAAFGASVAISDSRIVVGEPFRDVSDQTDAGQAETYVHGMTWTHSATLTPYDGQHANDQFGWSVAVERNKVLVGAIWDNPYVGSVYPFVMRFGSPIIYGKITPWGTTSQHFGCAVGVSNGNIAVGARMSAPDTVLSGAAQVFSSRGAITGYVRDAETGDPLPNIEVGAYWSDAPDDPPLEDLTFTNAAGFFSIPLDTGKYALGAMDMTSNYFPVFYNGAPLYPGAMPVMLPAYTTVPNINISMQAKLAPVYRFYNKTNGSHFYTNSFAERSHVMATWPNVFDYEGVAYRTNRSTDASPLYRFYNKKNGSHFYTASAQEADHVIATWPDVFSFDGPTYAVSTVPGPGKRPVYRFYNKTNGSHFYTSSPEEADHVKATWPNVFDYEGPAFWIGG